jgi:hypothetical protein
VAALRALWVRVPLAVHENNEITVMTWYSLDENGNIQHHLISSKAGVYISFISF